MIVIITSVKDNIDEAKNSVYRRFEYVYQSIRKMRVPVNDLVYIMKYLLVIKFS